MTEHGTEDAVARNRATPRRHAPGRPGLGAAVTRRLGIVTIVLLVLATFVLVVLLVLAS